MLKSEFGILCVANLNNESLQFSYDLGVNCTRRINNDNSFIHYLSTETTDNIDLEFTNQYHGALRFNLSRYLSYSGNAIKLKLLFKNSNFLIAADIFGNSPLYYAIMKKTPRLCILLEKIEVMRTENPKTYELSIVAIRNDFSLIIKTPRDCSFNCYWA